MNKTGSTSPATVSQSGQDSTKENHTNTIQSCLVTAGAHYTVTNKQLSILPAFIDLCNRHSIKATSRQASKYRRGFGSLYIAEHGSIQRKRGR